MITFKNKLDVLIKEGSTFSEEEILFLEKEYESLVGHPHSYTQFVGSLENKMKVLLEESSSIYHLSFSIKTKHKQYRYGKDPDNALYDIASVTKFFTLALLYLLDQKGILSLEERIVDILPVPETMKNVTVLDLLKMVGELRTDGKLSDTKDEDDFMKCLYTVHPIPTEKRGVYTDIGFTLLRFFTEKKVEAYTGTFKRYDAIMDEYVLKPYGLFHTMYVPDFSYILLGNGNREGQCNDKKSRIIQSVNGAAGLFSTLSDLDHFIECILEYKIFSPSFIKDIFSYSFLDTSERRRSYAGLYLPCLSSVPSYASKWYSHRTLAHQGYTGALVIGDFENHLINSILVDAIKEGEFVKGKSFLEEFRKIHRCISLYSILFYLLYE